MNTAKKWVSIIVKLSTTGYSHLSTNNQHSFIIVFNNYFHRVTCWFISKKYIYPQIYPLLLFTTTKDKFLFNTKTVITIENARKQKKALFINKLKNIDNLRLWRRNCKVSRGCSWGEHRTTSRYFNGKKSKETRKFLINQVLARFFKATSTNQFIGKREVSLSYYQRITQRSLLPSYPLN